MTARTKFTCDQVARKALGAPTKQHGRELLWRCPRHDDRHESLSINPKKDVFLCGPCNTSGTAWELAAFLSGSDAGDGAAVTTWLTEQGILKKRSGSDRHVVATYVYMDVDRAPIARKLRYEPKAFSWQRWEGGRWIDGLASRKPPIYRLPEVVANSDVFIVEGEKDADAAVQQLGVCGTTCGSATDKWLDEYTPIFAGKNCMVIPDMDAPGKRKAEIMLKALQNVAASVLRIDLPEAKDLSDWIVKGGTCEALLELVRNTSQWKPTTEATVPQVGAILRCFSDIALMPVRWLWPGRIPIGKQTLLIGDPGLGKSLITADIAGCVSSGRSFPDGAACELGGVIFLSAEDDPADTIRPRLDAARADVSRVYTLEAVRVTLTDGTPCDKTFNLETDVTMLEATLRVHPDVRLIVIDPISAYLGGVDSHSNAEVRAILTPLAALAAKFGVAVLCVTHLRKSAGAAIYRAISSIAFAAAARAVWAVAPDPEDADRRLLLAVKQNLSANIGGLAFRIETQSNVPCLAWEPDAVALTANEVLGVEVQQDQNERSESKEWLKDFLADGPVAVKKIQQQAKAAGLSWITVRRAKDALSVVAGKDGFKGGWQWRLKDTQHEDAHPIDTPMSTFERDVENMNLNKMRADEDAHLPGIYTVGDDGEVRL